MSSDDEDMFHLSDDEIITSAAKNNPAEDFLFSELNNIQERIDVVKNNIQEVEISTEQILKQFAHRVKYGENLENNQGEWVTFSGEPIIEPHTQIIKCCQPLTVRDFQQYIFDDKWIILVNCYNGTNWCLKDLRFYIILKDNKSVHGASTFWKLFEETFWNTTKIIEPKSSLVGTVILDVPVFDKESLVKASGIILYEADGKHYQTMIPNFQLSIGDTIDQKFTLQLENRAAINVLALKAVSVEKVVLLNMKAIDANERLTAFFEKYKFEEFLNDVQIVKDCGSLKYCILEMLSFDDDELKVRISARNSSQLSIALSLLREDFPDVPELEDEENCLQAAQFLLHEMQLYLSNASQAEIQRAKINTDYHIS